MDPAVLPSLRTCIKCVFLMLYLLQCTCSTVTEPCSGCTDVPLVPLTQPVPGQCFPTGKVLRYNCTKGYVRKAGTSNLIRCIGNQWSQSNLNCTVNPRSPPQPTLKQTSTTAFPTSTMSRTIDLFTSESSETPSSKSTPIVLPSPHSTAETPFGTTASSQSSKTPSGTTASSQSSNSPKSTTASSMFAGVTRSTTSSTSSPTTTHRLRILDTTMSPNSSLSSQHDTQAVDAKVIGPVAVGVIALAVVGAVWFLHRRNSRKIPKRNGIEKTPAEEHVLMQQMDNMT